MTDKDWENIQYFKKGDFACPCCGVEKIERELVLMLDIARAFAGVPFFVNSGYRCKKHNEKVGGKTTSTHLKGGASDIKAQSSTTRFRILFGLIRAGFVRVGIGKTFIHADIDKLKAPKVAWLY